jgi:hypothetical protein
MDIYGNMDSNKDERPEEAGDVHGHYGSRKGRGAADLDKANCPK